MATDLPLKFHECGNPAVLGALDPFAEILFCRVIGRELEDETKLLLQFMGTTEPLVLGLDHHEPFALFRRQVLGVLAKRILRAFESLNVLLQRLDPFGRLGIFAPGLLVGLRLLHKVRKCNPRTSPCVQPNGIDSIVRPFDDMERVHATVSVRAVRLHAFGDPFRAVSGHDPDGRALFFGQLGEEQLQHLLAVAVMGPDDGVRVMVDDHRDVRMALAVAGLVDADVGKPVQPPLRVRLQIVPDELHKAPDRLPVNLQPFRDLLLAESALEHPRRGIGEVGREACARPGPWNGGGEDAVLGAADPGDRCDEIYGRGPEVHAAPGAPVAGMVVDGAFPAACRTSPAIPPVRTDTHPQGDHFVVARGEVDIFDNCPLDVQELFQYHITRHPVPFADNGF